MAKDSTHVSSIVVGFDTVYKVKDDEVDRLRLNEVNVLHGNRDRDRSDISRDWASADLIVVRIVISLDINLGLDFGTEEVKGPYMQKRPIKYAIYVRPTKDYI